MPGSIKRVTLTSDQLSDLRSKLQDVIDEAQRLRDEVARALFEGRERGKRPPMVAPRVTRPRRSVVSRAR
jgi:hypothetical protein